MVDAIPKSSARVEMGEALLRATEADKRAEVARLLDARADPLYQGKRGGTALHDAASLGHSYCVQELLQTPLGQSGMLVAAKDSAGQTAIHCAAANGHDEALEDLLGMRSKAGKKDDSLSPEGPERVTCTLPLELLAAKTYKLGWTALHYAAHNGHAVCIDLLMDAASHSPEILAATNNSGRTALHVAAHAGHNNCCETLLQTQDAVKQQLLEGITPDGHTAMHLAARYGRKECIEVLGTTDPYTVQVGNARGHPSLHEAARRGHADCVDTLLQMGGTQGLSGMTSKYAQTRGFSDIADVLAECVKTSTTPAKDVKQKVTDDTKMRMTLSPKRGTISPLSIRR
eukprot:TRINITY_DN22511_c0_g1_i1.p1 TRINITY_DN22511_c0_g1~~TRINITY_DN22511_c0_g1_i1.p1  ORF type:complete len:343 (+),score=63.63 TRINITY_DN22511_c0_g1_i1:75-1103(+)